jgi:phosphate starvation-inducible protein PhoH and related proteins
MRANPRQCGFRRENRAITLKNTSAELTLAPLDNAALANLCGALDNNLRQIETALDVSIKRREASFRIEGADAVQAKRTIEKFYRDAHRAPLTLESIQLGLVESKNASRNGSNNGHSAPQVLANGTVVATPALKTRRSDLSARTPNQHAYLQNVAAHDITFGVGPAGTGKTYLAVACAVDAIERDLVKRIVLVRPAVEAGERLGFLPGDLAQKVDPYLRPLYDALYDLMGAEKVQKLFERGAIEIAPLAYMRGRTLSQSFIILDEAQNTTPEQMKMFLTRVGMGTKAVVTGDPTQVDLQRHQKSGLIDAVNVLKNVRGIAMTHFTSADVVRHPLVQHIIDAYDAHATHTKPSAPA